MKSVHAGTRSQEDIQDLIFDNPLGYQSLERYLQEKEAEENDGIDEETAAESQSFLQKGSYGSLSPKNLLKRETPLHATVYLLNNLMFLIVPVPALILKLFNNNR